MPNEKKPIPNYFCFFIFSYSKFDVRCSFVLQHSNNLALYEILTSDFCLLKSLIYILGDKASSMGNPVPGPLDPGIYEHVVLTLPGFLHVGTRQDGCRLHKSFYSWVLRRQMYLGALDEF